MTSKLVILLTVITIGQCLPASQTLNDKIDQAIADAIASGILGPMPMEDKDIEFTVADALGVQVSVKGHLTGGTVTGLNQMARSSDCVATGDNGEFTCHIHYGNDAGIDLQSSVELKYLTTTLNRVAVGKVATVDATVEFGPNDTDGKLEVKKVTVQDDINVTVTIPTQFIMDTVLEQAGFLIGGAYGALMPNVVKQATIKGINAEW